MTDDELDRALVALPLEEQPADQHGRILAATVLRPAPTFRIWELFLLAVGISSVWWISSLPFMATPRLTVYNR
jgi:hypothetical protein